jgi:dienelactone hydrolase
VANVFTSRGYVVAFPVRQGYGESGGEDREIGGPCNNADFISAGNAGADDVAVAIAHLKTLPYVTADKAIVVGQSVGGLVTLALASRNLEDIRAYVNFAGGHGGRRNGKANSNCSPDALVAAAAHFGRTVRRPMLWIYTENDTFFPPSLSRSMYAAFKKEGGTARFEMLPPFRTDQTQDGHDLMFASGGRSIWEPIVIRWLDANTK